MTSVNFFFFCGKKRCFAVSKCWTYTAAVKTDYHACATFQSLFKGVLYFWHFLFLVLNLHSTILLLIMSNIISHFWWILFYFVCIFIFIFFLLAGGSLISSFRNGIFSLGLFFFCFLRWVEVTTILNHDQTFPVTRRKPK